MKADKFEDLVAWQKARELTNEVYRITRTGNFAKDYGLCDQVRRSAVSIMSNIAEGFDRASRAEFHQFLVVAKGSAAEVRSQLYVAHDIGYIDKETFTRLKVLADETSKITNALRAAVQRQRDNKK